MELLESSSTSLESLESWQAIAACSATRTSGALIFRHYVAGISRLTIARCDQGTICVQGSPGSWDGERWQTWALVDFSDARVGDLLYELVALHIDLFQLDTRLLRAFLEAYGSPWQGGLISRTGR